MAKTIRLNESQLKQAIRKSIMSVLQEGSWGYSPRQSDDFLDGCRELYEPILDALLKGFKNKEVNNLWCYLGYTIECLRLHDILGECLYWSDEDEETEKVNGKNRKNYGIMLINAFNKAYEFVKENYKEMGWEYPDKFRMSLEKVKSAFDKLMEERKIGIGEEKLNQHRKIWKERDRLHYIEED